MPTGRILKYCLALSVLFHVAVAALASLIPVSPRQADDVMVVDLADMPRSTDFLPPKPGIVEGQRPQPPKPPLPAPKEKPPKFRSGEIEGPVPKLPVDPSLPPEGKFEERPARVEPAPPRQNERPAQAARAAEQPREAKQAAPAGGAESAAKSGVTKSLRDLTPGLGETVLAMRERGGGRGRNSSDGKAVGTDAKAGEKGGIVEERGAEAHLTPLNAPEIQYISYFAGLKGKIELVWQYPYEAMLANIHGTVIVDFVIGRNGQLERVDLVRSSGSKILDDEAIRSLRVAAPFDPIPKEYAIPNLPVRGQFLYGGVSPIQFYRR